MSDTIELTPACPNCRYSVMQDAAQGTCNRYAPRPLLSPDPFTLPSLWWPPVTATTWCGEWALPPTDDELFAAFLERNGELPTFEGIPVLPPMPTPQDEPGPQGPEFRTYEDHFEDPLR